MRLSLPLGLSMTLVLTSCLPAWTSRPAQDVPPPGPRSLIVNADDLGLSPGVTEGIVAAWREGVVTTTSALVNLDGAAERIREVHRAHPDLPIGLHLNVTTGRPVLPAHQVPSLVDAQGNFFDRDTLMERALDVSLAELEAELRAQGDRLRAAGVPFDHMDYHEGVLFLYTPFYAVVRKLAREWNVPVRHPVPESVYGRVSFPGGGGTSGMMWKMLGFGILHPFRAWRMMPHMVPDAFKRQAALLEAEGIPSPVSFIDGFFGVASTEAFVGMLGQLPPGINEVSVHPGQIDAALHTWGGGYVQQREAELAVLRDPRVKEAIAARAVALTTFGALKASPARE